MSQFPKTIEVGNGPNIEVNSQAEADAFHAAARNNTRLIREQEFADGARLMVVCLYNSDIERPTAPLAITGPFEDAAAAREFAAKWTDRTASPFVKAHAQFVPTPDEFEEWITAGGYDLVDDAEASDVS